MDKTSATKGETIMVTVSPESGYSVSSLTYTPEGASQQRIINSRFTMPAANVTVNAVFEQTPTPVGPHIVLTSTGSGFPTIMHPRESFEMNVSLADSIMNTAANDGTGVHVTFTSVDDPNVFTINPASVTLTPLTPTATVTVTAANAGTAKVVASAEGYAKGETKPITVSDTPTPGSYSLIIPSAVPLQKGQTTSAPIGVTFTDQTNMRVKVTLTSTDVEGGNDTFILRAGMAEAKYRIADTGDAFKPDYTGPFIKSGDVVLEADSTQTKNLYFGLIEKPMVAGTYTGTITITATAA